MKYSNSMEICVYVIFFQAAQILNKVDNEEGIGPK